MTFLNDIPIPYGWAATKTAVIGELKLSFSIPSDHFYLWDFRTLPSWRGLGIYPLLLQAILKSEVTNATTFWIAHAPENRASARGIQRAGFMSVGELSFLKSGQGVGLASITTNDFAYQGAKMLQVEWLKQANSALAPCWRCILEQNVIDLMNPPACWSGSCCCTR